MTRRMYGDLLNGIVLSLSLPLLVFEACKTEPNWTSVRTLDAYSHHSTTVARSLQERQFLLLPFARFAPVMVCALFVVTILYNARAYWSVDRAASCGAFLTLHGISTLLILYEWPNPGDESIWTHVVWHFLIATTNLQQTFSTKCTLGVLSAAQKVLTVCLSPRYTLRETVPIIMGATVVFILLNFGLCCLFDSSIVSNAACVEKQSWRTCRTTAVYTVLLVLFVCFSMMEVSNIIERPGYIAIGSRKVITASVFGVVGLIVGGAFRDRSSSTPRTVSHETLATFTSTMLLTTQALNASQTAVAITDLERKVLMINPAFELLTGHTPGTIPRDTLLEDVLQQAGEDAIRVMCCYLVESTGEDDFMIATRIIRVKVTPSSLPEMDGVDDDMIMIVVLRDMTHERALEQAVETAHQHALRTRAIMGAIEALTRQMQAGQPQPLPPPPQQQFAMVDVIPDNDDEFDMG